MGCGASSHEGMVETTDSKKYSAQIPIETVIKSNDSKTGYVVPSNFNVSAAPTPTSKDLENNRQQQQQQQLPLNTSKVQQNYSIPEHEIDHHVISRVPSKEEDDGFIDPHTNHHHPHPDVIRWKKGQLLGSGAFGRVFLALNFDTGKLMAAKEICFTSQDKAVFEDLMLEVGVMSKLDHPNIVRYFGTCLENSQGVHSQSQISTSSISRCFIFLEYVPGGSLLSLLEKFGRFNEALTYLYTKQMLLGLEYLHDNSIIHRDIKAANVLMDDGGCIKLADFGSSIQETNEEARERKHAGLKGTPYYMAPEAIRESRCTALSDVWSLGCTVVQLLTGKYPWVEKKWTSPATAMLQIASSEEIPHFPQEVITPRLTAFILSMLERDITKRLNVKALLQHQFIVEQPEMHSSFEDEEDEDYGILSNVVSPVVDDASHTSSWYKVQHSYTQHEEEKRAAVPASAGLRTGEKKSASSTLETIVDHHDELVDHDDLVDHTPTKLIMSDGSSSAANKAESVESSLSAGLGRGEFVDDEEYEEGFVPPAAPEGNPFSSMSPFADPSVCSSSIFSAAHPEITGSKWISSQLNPTVIEAWNGVLAERTIKVALASELAKEIPEETRAHLHTKLDKAKVWDKLEKRLHSRYHKHMNKWQTVAQHAKEHSIDALCVSLMQHRLEHEQEK